MIRSALTTEEAQRAADEALMGPYADAIDDGRATEDGPVLTCLADIDARPVRWLWRGRIPLGRITLIVGRPGEGKSYLTLDVASRVSTGSPWPDGAPCEGGSAIIVSAEDDPHDTIRPRLDAHRADVKRIYLLSAVRWMDDEAGELRERCITLADLPAIEAALTRVPDCRLLIIDPIGSYLGGRIDSHRDSEVRSILAPLAALAERYGVAVLIVAHRRKSGADVADDLALGSRAFTGIARAVWHLSRDAQDRNRRLLLPGKMNLSAEGNGLAFTIGGDPASIVWERDPVAMSADDGLAAEQSAADGPGRPAAERDEAADWLRAELSDLAEHPVADVEQSARAAGLTWRTVRRAASELRVIRHRGQFGGGYTWRLPRPESTPRDTSRDPAAHAGQNGQDTPEKWNLGQHGQQGEIQRKTGDSAGQNSHAGQNYLLGQHGEKPSNGHPRYGLPDGPRSIAPLTAEERDLYGLDDEGEP